MTSADKDRHIHNIRIVAAILAAERMQGWANPLVSYLTDAADAWEDKPRSKEPAEAVLSRASTEPQGE
jgi:hypothetical protein